MSRAVLTSTSYELRRLKLCAGEAVGRVLDLGHAQLPNPYLDGSRTVGLDLALPARPSGYSADIQGSVMDLERRVAGARFDTVVAGELIEHLERPYDFLRGVREVLEPGGRLVLSTPNPIGFPPLIFEILGSRRWFYTPEHTFYFPPRWVIRMLEHSGYQLDRVRTVGLWMPWGYIPWCPRWMSYQLIYRATALP